MEIDTSKAKENYKEALDLFKDAKEAGEPVDMEEFAALMENIGTALGLPKAAAKMKTLLEEIELASDDEESEDEEEEDGDDEESEDDEEEEESEDDEEEDDEESDDDEEEEEEDDEDEKPKKGKKGKKMAKKKVAKKASKKSTKKAPAKKAAGKKGKKEILIKMLKGKPGVLESMKGKVAMIRIGTGKAKKYSTDEFEEASGKNKGKFTYQQVKGWD